MHPYAFPHTKQRDGATHETEWIGTSYRAGREDGSGEAEEGAKRRLETPKTAGFGMHTSGNEEGCLAGKCAESLSHFPSLCHPSR